MTDGKRQKILFRADANPSIGTGDIMSFLYLARRFSRRGWTPFFLVRDYPAALALVREHGIDNVTFIEKGCSIDEEVNAINNLIAKRRIGAVFLQINERPLSAYEAMTEVYKCCVCFEYNMPRDFNLALSWDIDSAKYFDPERHAGTKLFLGPEYVILPDNFDHDRIATRAAAPKRSKLLVAMGGADEHDITALVAGKLIELGCDLEVTFILGSGYQFGQELARLLESSPLSYCVKRNVPDMFDHYLACDVAIGAGGLTASELVATRTPALLVATHEHQIRRCEYFAEMKWCKYLGFGSDFRLTLADLQSFSPDRQNGFHSRIDEVVDYMDRQDL